jgi:SAM-dependent methyltransferase
LATLSIHGYSVHGIELDEGAAAAASRLIGGERVSREPIERFPGSEAFDCVTAFAVLEHVTSPTSFMQSAARLLKPGGYVILHVPNALYLLSRTRLLGSANWQVPDGHIHHFTMGSLGRLLTSTGFEIVSQFWHGHPYIPRSRGALPRWRASTVSHAKQLLWMATGQRANLSPSLNIVARKRPTGSTGS